MKSYLASELKSLFTSHRPNRQSKIFIFSAPRSGSTWLTELIWSQPGFQKVSEPLNLRQSFVRQRLGLRNWLEFYEHKGHQKLDRYYCAFREGRLHYKLPWPWQRNFRILTNRIVFKVIHGGEDRINWYSSQFGVQAVLLYRQPFAVSLSRKVFPRLKTYVSSNFRQNLSAEEIALSERIIESGSKLEQGVLSWCLQNLVPLQRQRPDWIVISYEQLALEPERIIRALATQLDLPRPELLRRGLKIPSGSALKSDFETQGLLKAEEKDRHRLIEKWHTQVNSNQEHRLMGILTHFGFDIYQAESDLPGSQYWL